MVKAKPTPEMITAQLTDLRAEQALCARRLAEVKTKIDVLEAQQDGDDLRLALALSNSVMRDVIEQAACDLARIEPSPAKWQAAVVYLLKLLEGQASAGGPAPLAAFQIMLQLLAGDIETQIKCWCW